jgi:excinuclease ABC subunit A
MASEELVVHGAREHNLKDVTVRLPRNKLICITGLSGSGKSSLAFDTIYAEGQRRYVESLSAYARQFLQMMEKPDVDSIDGLSPAISIDQKTTSRNPRSTVGTVTEIYDYLRLLYARVGRPHCPVCGKPITGQSQESIVDQILQLPEKTKFTVNAPVVRDRKGEYKDVFEELRNEGFTRVKVDGEQRLLEEEIKLDKKFKHTIEVVVDRLTMTTRARSSSASVSPAQITACRCPSCSRASSPSTRRTARARAAPVSARSRRSTPTCSSPTRPSRSRRERWCRGPSGTQASTSR